jgi:hypothetical protein
VGGLIYDLEMIPENRLLFACTRQDFLVEHRETVLDVCSDAEIRWEAVCSTARLHGVAPLVYSNLLECDTSALGMPQEIVRRFKLCYYRNIATKEERVKRIKRALAFFNAQQIDVMLIKGVALDLLVYNHPWYVVSDDVDVVIKRKRRDVSDEDHLKTMRFFHRTGIEFDYYQHHDVVLNGVLPINFQRIWNDASRADIGDSHAFVMSPEDMLISVCTNSCRKRFFRLKCLCDIAETVSQFGDLNWAELIRKAREDHCDNIVYTALLATKMTLGCELPDRVLRDLAVGPVRDELIRQLISYVSRHAPLSSLYPYSEGKWFDRKVSVSLLLPYATYRPRQMWRRINQLRDGWGLRGPSNRQP